MDGADGQAIGTNCHCKDFFPTRILECCADLISVVELQWPILNKVKC